MPDYTQGTAKILFPGDIGYSFNAETPTPSQAGAAFVLFPPQAGISAIGGMSMQASFATAPTSATVLLEVSNDDVNYVTQDTLTFATPQTVQMSVQAGSSWRFARGTLSAQSGGGAVTISITRI